MTLIEMLHDICAVALFAASMPWTAATLLHLRMELEPAPWQRWAHTTLTPYGLWLNVADLLFHAFKGEIVQSIFAVVGTAAFLYFKCEICSKGDDPPGGRRSLWAAIRAALEWRRLGVPVPIPA